MMKKYKKLLTRLSIFLIICISIKMLFFRDIQTISKTYHGYYIDNEHRKILGECNIEIKGIRREAIITPFDNYPPNIPTAYAPKFNGYITINGSRYPFTGRGGQKDDGSLFEDSYFLLVKNNSDLNKCYSIFIYNNLNELYFSTSEEYNKELVWASTEKFDNFNDILDKLPIYYGKK
ncbi:hypothetical protein D3C81_690900 [compost metagenome]